MRRWLLIILLLQVAWLSGCSDRMEIDESSISTIVGMDVNDSNEMLIRSMVLAFNEEAKSNEVLLSAKGDSLRKTRIIMSSKSGGEVMSGKLQILLVSNKLLSRVDLFPYLDVAYRDAKISNSAIIVTCACSVDKLLSTKLQSQPILTEYLRKLIESGHKSEMTVRTSIQKFHYMRFEPGMNAQVSEIKPTETEIAVTGTALLNNKGKYAAHLNKEESALLLLLQGEIKIPVVYSTVLTVNGKETIVSTDIKRVRTKIKSSFGQNRFHFKIDLPVHMQITEFEAGLDVAKEKEQLQKLLKEQMEKDFKALIHKLQKNKTDPIGLGIHTRAFHYKQWKNVRDNWSQAFSEAEITINPKVEIKRFGVVN